MVDSGILFPILELTDWVFDGEKVLEPESEWKGPAYIKEKDLEKHYQRQIIDSKGSILKVTMNKVIRKEGSWLPFIIPVKLVVEFNLELTGRSMSLFDAKRKIVSRSAENFHITYSKLISETDYNNKISAARTFKELFEVAAIVGED